MRLLDRRGQLALDDELHGLVNREHERLPVPRPRALALEGPPLRVGVNDHAARLARQRRAVNLLDSGESFVVESDEADHVRRERAVRVASLLLLDRVDALDLQTLDCARLLLINFAREPDEPAPRVPSFFQTSREHACVHVEDARELRRSLVRVLYLARVCEDGVNADAAREFSSLSVEYETAHRHLRLNVQLLRARPPRQPIVLRS